MGGAAASATQDGVVEGLEERGAEVVGNSVIEASDGDTFAQNTELALIMEKVQESGAEAIMINGTPSASIRGIGAAGLNGKIAVWTNNSGGLNNLGETIGDKSIADGVLTSAGPTESEIYADPLYQSACNDVIAAAIPDADLREPTEYQTEEEKWFKSTRRACRHLALFVEIATAAGVNLTHDTFGPGLKA